MPAEQRLHPLSILFRLGAQVRTFGIPGLLVLVTAGSAGWAWQVWTMPLLIPFAVWSIIEYASFRYRFDPNEMVIRTGFLFRNERHVPYARIQNLHAIQGVFHRLLGMVEVRVETGGAEEPEATMSVLPVAAFEEMQRRVFGERAEVEAAGESTSSGAGSLLLSLPPREIMLYGLIQNRGFVVIAAFWGILWELGLLDGIWDRFFGDDFSGRKAVRTLFRAIFSDGGISLEQVALAFAAILLLLVVARLCSMGWALVRLYGFRLTRTGDDLRTEHGLLTRIKTAIPIRRIQTLTVQEGPLHRLASRVSVRVAIAGGKEEESSTQREWLAPILRRGELPGLLATVMPGLDLSAVDWRGLHPRAFRREIKGWIVVAILISAASVWLLEEWSLALLAILLAGCVPAARKSIAHLRWAVSDDAILFRSGWLWRKTTVVRFPKIQAVAIHESPFDRRAAMASVAVDTAGIGQASHRVNIPYLARETARNLCDLLAGQADRTAFRW
jgi:putative membrane protein